MMFDLSGMMMLRNGRSRSINWENRNGEKGAGCKAASVLGPSRKGSPCIGTIESGETVTLADIKGPGVIQHIWCTVDDATPAGRFVLRDMVLRMYWDNEETPSVECPLGDFFTLGFGASYEVVSLPMCVMPKRGMNCYIPMPFGSRARVTLENQHPGPLNAFFYQIDYCLYDELPANAGFFHAQWRRQRLTELGRDYVVLDGVRGKGQYMGTFLALSTLERYWWGEGEMKFYIDGDDEYPTQCSTGTEDYFGGAWSFGAKTPDGRTYEKTYCTPFMGYPFYSRDDNFINNYFNADVPPMRAFYRWHIPDPILFDSDLRVELQQIGVGEQGLFERQDDVSTVAYWYQTEPHAPFPELPASAARRPR